LKKFKTKIFGQSSFACTNCAQFTCEQCSTKSEQANKKDKNDRICNYCLTELNNTALIEFFNDTLERKQQSVDSMKARHYMIDEQIKNIRQETAV